MQCSCSRRDVLGWLLFMVTKYLLFQTNALLEKSYNVSTAILQSSSEHTQHAQNTALVSHRYQCCGVKLIDTHCKTVAVMVSYDSILVCELCGQEICREFLVNTIVVHMK